MKSDCNFSFQNSFQKNLFLLLFCLPASLVFGQKDPSPIALQNPSFEDLPKSGQTPKGWYDCGPSAESPPDVQPGHFSVTKAPSNGESYMGLVVRDNETWEGVSQRLSRPLEVNQCYDFSMDIARSELYLSLSRTTGEQTNYAVPAVLKIWGGMGYCDKKELLAQSSVITNTRWLTYNFRLAPKKGSYTYIIFEAYYKTPIMFPTNGNVLLDNTSVIRPVPCDKEKKPDEELAKTDPKPTPVKTPVQPVKKPSTTRPEPVKPQPLVNKFDRKNLKEGLTIPVENIYFQADSSRIKPESEAGLMEIFRFMASNPDIKIEVGGHTNNIPSEDFCNELSTARARAVFDWLIGRGIANERVQYKGYGKRLPRAPNASFEGRQKNQRVEVKILDMNG